MPSPEKLVVGNACNGVAGHRDLIDDDARRVLGHTGCNERATGAGRHRLGVQPLIHKGAVLFEVAEGSAVQVGVVAPDDRSYARLWRRRGQLVGDRCVAAGNGHQPGHLATCDELVRQAAVPVYGGVQRSVGSHGEERRAERGPDLHQNRTVRKHHAACGLGQLVSGAGQGGGVDSDPTGPPEPGGHLALGVQLHEVDDELLRSLVGHAGPHDVAVGAGRRLDPVHAGLGESAARAEARVYVSVGRRASRHETGQHRRAGHKRSSPHERAPALHQMG